MPLRPKGGGTGGGGGRGYFLGKEEPNTFSGASDTAAIALIQAQSLGNADWAQYYLSNPRAFVITVVGTTLKHYVRRPGLTEAAYAPATTGLQNGFRANNSRFIITFDTAANRNDFRTIFANAKNRALKLTGVTGTFHILEDIDYGTSQVLFTLATEVPSAAVYNAPSIEFATVSHKWFRAEDLAAIGDPGDDGISGSYERTIFRVGASAPATETAPNSVASAGVAPTLPAGAAATPPDTTQTIFAAIQRVAPGSTTVTYTAYRRWTGPPGPRGPIGPDGTVTGGLTEVLAHRAFSGSFNPVYSVALPSNYNDFDFLYASIFKGQADRVAHVLWDTDELTDIMTGGGGRITLATSGGAIASANVASAGSGYTAGTYDVPGGDGGQITITVNASGAIQSAAVAAAGSGYSAATFDLLGGVNDAHGAIIRASRVPSTGIVTIGAITGAGDTDFSTNPAFQLEYVALFNAAGVGSDIEGTAKDAYDSPAAPVLNSITRDGFHQISSLPTDAPAGYTPTKSVVRVVSVGSMKLQSLEGDGDSRIRCFDGTNWLAWSTNLQMSPTDMTSAALQSLVGTLGSIGEESDWNLALSIRFADADMAPLNMDPIPFLPLRTDIISALVSTAAEGYRNFAEIQAKLGEKAPLASPTFTGSVKRTGALPADATARELADKGYVDENGGGGSSQTVAGYHGVTHEGTTTFDPVEAEADVDVVGLWYIVAGTGLSGALATHANQLVKKDSDGAFEFKYPIPDTPYSIIPDTADSDDDEGIITRLIYRNSEWHRIVDGYQNTVSGVLGRVSGGYNTVSGDYAAADGRNNSVEYEADFAAGRQNRVRGPAASALGRNNFATGEGAHATGKDSVAQNTQARAHGLRAEARTATAYTTETTWRG